MNYLNLKKPLIIIFPVLFFMPQLLSAQKQNPWNNLNVNAKYTDKWQEISSAKKQLNKEVLNSILEKVETNGKTSLAIPTPEGLESYFEIIESNVMAPELKVKYPNIKTYKGLNNNGDRIRLTMAVNEFHATIFSDEGAYEIKPETIKSDVYVSYRSSDYYNRGTTSDLSCGVEDKIENEITNNLYEKTTSADFTPRRIGGFHSKYRIAIIPDLVYVQYFGGTVEGALSGIVTTVNTVNEIFERDMGISLELIGNNDSIIYTSKGAYESEDDYDIVNAANASKRFLLTGLLNELIGVENYDVGHLFKKNYPGGTASVSSICNDGHKAVGVSGSGVANPEGYNFDVAIFGHELGHQFGSGHTFSASCLGNSYFEDAYEIGSGVTIMGYGFGCAGYNTLEYPILDYFNARTIERIVRRSENNNCGTVVATGNTAPNVSVIESGFTIPINTPFMLEAVGTDEDGDVLTFCWEQYDPSTKEEDVRYAPLGVDGEIFSSTEELQAYYDEYLINLENEYIAEGFTEDQYGFSLDSFRSRLVTQIERFWEGNGPLFRGFSPTEDNKRCFPQLSKVLNGTATTSSYEVMPHKTRDLNFVVTVRDNSILGAGLANDIVSFSSTEDAGPFEITTSFTDSNYPSLTDVELEWDVANTDVSPVNCQKVDVLYSTNGGETFDITLLEGISNNGKAVINLPNIETSTGRIMIKAADNIFFNVNDTNFIVSNVLDIDENEFIKLTIYPNPVEQTLYIDTEEEILLKLIDFSGKTLITKNIDESTTLDMSNFSSGIYILTVKNKYNTVYKKIIKE